MEQPPPRETRVPVNLRIKFRSETIEQFVERYAIDVSRGGIFIRTREPLAVGTQLKFDFQLQDTTPLMAGEGTVVWIREHDPTRAGVTPGMGVRFDRLTPASQPVLDRILTDKARLATGAANAGAASATVTGKSGVGPLPARRASSTFSALDPGALGIPTATQSSTGTSPGLGAPVSPPVSSLAPAATTGSSSPSLKPLVPTASSGPGLASRPPVLSSPSPPSSSVAARAPGPASGALPTLESQSALGRLATGPNLSAFSPLAPRSKSPVPLPPRGATAPAAGDSSGPGNAASGSAAVPTPIEDSERTQIAEGLPDFSSEPTHVGNKSQDVADLMAGRNATIAATSHRTPTPLAGPGLSLDAVVGSGPTAGAGAGSSSAAAPSSDSGAGAMRTTSPDGSTSAPLPGGSGLGRLSAAGMPAVTPLPSSPAGVTADTDLAETVPAAARMSAITSTMRPDTPLATPGLAEKKRPTIAIVVGVLVGAVAAAAIALQISRSGGSEPAVTATAGSAPAPAAAPAPDPNPPPAANPEGTAAPGSAPVAAANPAREANSGEAKPGEAAGKPTEAAKPAEAVAPEARPAEVKPAEAAPAEAEAAPAAKPGRKPRLLGKKKGATAVNKAEAALEAAAATGEDSAPAADAGNIARVISLPSGAEVLIDGQSVGKTPFVGNDIDPRAPHALTVRKDGFENYEHMVSSSDWIKGKGNGQTLKLVVKLRKAEGAGSGDKKAEKAGEGAESGKTEPPPAAESP
jgi:uncharacterized protein (TIGR02266 family)